MIIGIYPFMLLYLLNLKSAKEILIRYKYPLILSGIIILSIWPISFYFFPTKWDNIDCYLPYKYFVSSFVNEGEWPFWNPFQNFGYPAYSDMQNGLWNPINWILIAVFGNYSASALSTELTFYFLLAGLGMYKFSSSISKDPYIRLICGLSFALSGFMVGTTQIMIFLMGIAWFPWILHATKKLYETKNIKYVFILGSLVALEATSASPAYTIVLIYILIGLGLYYFLTAGKDRITFVLLFVLAGSVSIVLVLPMINGFVEFAPYFGRLGKLKYLPWVYQGSFDFAEYTSFLFPMAVLSKSDIWGASDLTLRNGYFGVFGFISFVFALKGLKNSRNVQIFSLITLLFLLLAAGDYTPIYKWSRNLPGFGTFRHPSFFRSHAIFFMILISGVGLDKLKKKNTSFNWLVVGFIGICAATIIATIDNGTEHIPDLIKDIISFKEKPIYFSEPFICLNASILFVILIFYFILFNRIKNTSKLIFYLVIIDLGVQTQITAPTTMVNPKKNIAEFDEFYNKLPSFIDQAPLTEPLKKFNGYHEDYGPYPVWRNVGTFTKQISPKGHNAAQFKSFNKLEKNSGLQNVCLNPLIFVAKNSVDSAEMATLPNTVWGSDLINPGLRFKKKEIQHNAFYFEIENPSNEAGLVVLNQNFHHLWEAYLSNQEIKVELINDGLMGFKIPPNFNGSLQLNFNSPRTKLLFFISLLAYMVISILLLCSWYKDISKTN